MAFAGLLDVLAVEAEVDVVQVGGVVVAGEAGGAFVAAAVDELRSRLLC